MVPPPRPTKSRSKSVPLDSIDSRSGRLKHKFDRTPRISLITDATDIRAIPREIRALARDERRLFRDFSEWWRSKGNSDAALVWFVGERLLEGDTRGLLKSLHSHDCRSFVVVNTPCVDEVPFLTIQPRVFANAASIEHRSFRTRIESNATPATGTMVDTRRPVEPWAKLLEAISSEKTKQGTGVELLLCLWQSRYELPDVVAALALRNLVAVMLQYRESANARKFLEAGVKLYPTYAELHYLAALLAIRERRLVEARPFLERAKSCGVVFPGSGGENGYRCDWLLGVLAARAGDARRAFQYFLAGVKCNPLFEPSLTELLKLRLPRAMIESQQYAFTRAARLNSHMATRILEYLSTHGVYDAARRITQTIPLEPSQRISLENQPADSTAPLPTVAQPADDKNSRRNVKQAISIAFEGPFFEYSSLARVNREIALALLSSEEFEVRLETSSPAAQSPRLLPDGIKLTPSVHRRLHQTNLTIRHQWPPNFRRPPTGKLAVILPWEYGGAPRVWIEQIRQNVDELWVPSNFVREVFIRNGVPSERVVVIPNGYDPKIFTTEGPSSRPQGSRDFVFLFVGGVIRRKGVDLLLHAFEAAFDPSESVTLVFLISGSAGAYQHNSLLPEIQAAVTNPKQPPVLSIFETVDDLVLAGLYRGANVFVLPYRGEGFGMPLVEAMACGKPVITTAGGPAKEFCDHSNSYLVPATADLVFEPRPPLGPIAGGLTWFEPDFFELVATLRHVFENRQEVAAKGQAAAKSVRHLTWENATKLYADRIRRLCDP
jgi:glycosyltransferase involved in cell wall biosynthesis